MKEVTITVDGREITVPAGTLIIDACEQNDIYIPRFCYHKHLSTSGNCRMCLVKIEKNPKPQPSCMTPVADGMIIHTNTPEIIEMRKAMLEFVLINHPLDCPICDKAGECMLQDQYMEFSGDKSRFNEEKVAKGKLYEFSDRIMYDAERCITCSRCVRFTREISRTNKLGIVERGDKSYVSLATGDTFDDPYSLCVTDICPVGALTNRQFRFKERVWNLHSTESICAGCSRGCNILIQSKDNIVYRIIPKENDEVNKSWMCDFGRDFCLNSSENRLTGATIKGKHVEYKKVIEDIAKVLKADSADTAFILSSHATNEELALVKQLVDTLKITGIFFKADREWNADSDEIKDDDLLITADKTPNLAGLKAIFPNANEMKKFDNTKYKLVFIWAQNVDPAAVNGLKKIMLTTVIDDVSKKADWCIAGKTPVEKHGSFTNCDGIVQPFRKAVNENNNYDDLLFLVDLLKNLEIEPIGRTVLEVRQSIKS